MPSSKKLTFTISSTTLIVTSSLSTTNTSKTYIKQYRDILKLCGPLLTHLELKFDTLYYPICHVIGLITFTPTENQQSTFKLLPTIVTNTSSLSTTNTSKTYIK